MSRSKASWRNGPPEPNAKKPALPVSISERSSELAMFWLPMKVMRRTLTWPCSVILNLMLTSLFF